MSERITPYPLRMPPKLRQALEERTVKNGRSLNAEIISVLEENVQNQNVRIILLPKEQRIVSGKFLNLIDIDFKKSLTALQKDLDRLIPLMNSVGSAEQKGRIEVVLGMMELDIVTEHGESLDWITIRDIY